ncbi:amine oxidase [Alteromonadaceae bacterium M269]|nr:amine oxidase [Alteromonadaceae bacterium M269]
MAAGYLLAQNGIEFEILEASGSYGGRMKQTTSFVDFPIPLGAEWLHVPAYELASIVNNPKVKIATQTIGYDRQDIVGHYEDENYTTGFLGDPEQDRKFINSTWFDFFSTYIAPSITRNIRFNTVIKDINYSGNKTIITDNKSQTYSADKVIFTAPLKMLQEGTISFTPELPANKQRAIQRADIWGGIKVFIEFSHKFFPVILSFADSETRNGQRMYFNASYGQNSKRNVLGLFAVGQQAEQYQNLSGNDQRDYILAELDEVFDGAASKNYIQHLVQNWSEEPHIKSAYLSDVASVSTSNILAETLGNRVYFAGEAYTKFDDWGSVHAAARAARDAVRSILA